MDGTEEPSVLCVGLGLGIGCGWLELGMVDDDPRGFWIF